MAQASQPWRQRRKNPPSSIHAFLANEQQNAFDELVESPTGKSKVPYQTHVQRTPDLPEEVTGESIHIYADDPAFTSEAKAMVVNYADLWVNRGLIGVPDGEELTVALINNWHKHNVAQIPSHVVSKISGLLMRSLTSSTSRIGSRDEEADSIRGTSLRGLKDRQRQTQRVRGGRPKSFEQGRDTQ